MSNKLTGSYILNIVSWSLLNAIFRKTGQQMGQWSDENSGRSEEIHYIRRKRCEGQSRSMVKYMEIRNMFCIEIG